MKKYSILLTIILMALMTACDENASEFGKNENQLKNKYDETAVVSYCTCIENSNNPFEYIGQYHNAALASAVPNIQQLIVRDANNDVDRAATLSNIETYIRDFAVNELEVADPGAFGTVHGVTISDILDNPMVAVGTLNLNVSYSQDFKNLIQDFFDSISETEFDALGEFFNFDAKIQYCLAFENSIIANTTLGTEERNCLLTVVAVGKYSCAFWENYFYQLQSIDNQKSTNNNEIAHRNCSNRGEKLAAKTTCADAAGAYFGFLGGCLAGPAGMALGAFCGGAGASVAVLIDAAFD
jgi:hypothetical protein